MSIIERAAVYARKMPSTRSKVRAGRAFTGAVSWLGADPICLVEMQDYSVLELDARSRTEAGTVWNGSYEPEYTRLLCQLLDTFGATAYDIGANVGLIAIPLARHLKHDGVVVCFEPVQDNVTRLRRNVGLNSLDNCIVYDVALGAEEGEMRIARETVHGASSGNAILLVGREAGDRHTNTATVAIRRLDDVVASDSLPSPAVIKLDVEGSEVGVLLGAAATLAASRPIILGEFNSALMPRFGTTFLDVPPLLPEDYAIFGFIDANTVEEKPAAVGVGDVLLAPREKVDQLPIRRRSD